jgi:hypothetical protein
LHLADSLFSLRGRGRRVPNEFDRCDETGRVNDEPL